MKRKTEEVEITVKFGDEISVNTGDKVLDHLLNTLLFYSKLPVIIEASGDLPHHLWEDTGIVFGEFIKREAEKKEIARYGSAIISMDEALVLAAVDISRPYLVTDLNPEEREEGFSLTLTGQFLAALSRSLEATIHINQLSGVNSHHVIEAGFKALGVSLGQALTESTRVESTKGDRN